MNLDPNDGWQCCSLHDPAKRRGIWWRMTECGLLEIVAGREGDDATALVPPPHAELVAKCLTCGTIAMELADEKGRAAHRVATALLSILDAFEVMERERFSISVEGRGFTCVDKDGNAFTARFESPLLTLLAAADKLEGASDADSK